jgi:hypothetical protein
MKKDFLTRMGADEGGSKKSAFIGFHPRSSVSEKALQQKNCRQGRHPWP